MQTPQSLKYARIALPLWLSVNLPRGDACLETALKVAEPAAEAGDTETLDFWAGVAHECESRAMHQESRCLPCESQSWRDAAIAAHLAWLALREMSGVCRNRPRPLKGWPADQLASRLS